MLRLKPNKRIKVAASPTAVRVFCLQLKSKSTTNEADPTDAEDTNLSANGAQGVFTQLSAYSQT